MQSQKSHIFWIAIAIITSNSNLYSQPLGLDNFGATCYVNATIQALYNCTNLTQYLLTHPNNYPQPPQEALAYRYVDLIKALRAVSAGGAQQDAVEQLWGLELHNFVQQAYQVMGGCGHMDATEFIGNLLASLSSERPGLHTLFSIGQSSIVTCESIKYERTRVDTESYINLQAEGYSTLIECLSSYFNTESLSDDYALDLTPAELTKRPDLEAHNKSLIPGCTRTIGIDHLNEYIIITLKRFTQDQETAVLGKLSHDILVEQTLNLGGFMTGPAAIKAAQDYELIGAIVHSGTLRVGHYIAYVKVGNQWYDCNDTIVKPTTWALMETPEEQWKEYGINKSYALFYKRGVTGTIYPSALKAKIEAARKQEQEKRKRMEEESHREAKRLQKAEEERARLQAQLKDSLNNLTKALENLQKQLK